MRQNMNILGDIEVQVGIQSLIQALVKNKEKAARDFIEATEVYNADLKARATDALERILNGTYVDNSVMMNFGLTRPVDTQKNYDELIKVLSTVYGSDERPDMMKMTMSQVNCILNDEWDWAAAAKMSNAFYSTRAVKNG